MRTQCFVIRFIRALMRVVAIAVVGCRTPLRSLPAQYQNSLEGSAAYLPLASTIVVPPDGDATTIYSDFPPEQQPSPDTQALWDRIHAKFQGADDFTPDARLEKVARALLNVQAKGGVPSDALLQYLLYDHGVPERGFVVTANASNSSAPAEEIQLQVEALVQKGPLRIGVAHDYALGWLAVYVHVNAFRLLDTPRFVLGSSPVQIVGAMPSSLRDPTMVVTYDGATVEHLRMNVHGDQIAAIFSCASRRGEHWLNIEASDVSGRTARLAQFPVGCDPGTLPTYRVEPRTNIQHLDAYLVAALINRERSASGLQPLMSDVRVAAVARAYAQSMLAHGNVHHDLGSSTPEARLKSIGLLAPQVREVTLHADDAQSAAELILNDESYRDAIMSRELTNVGVGVTRDNDGGYYIAIVLIRLVPTVDMREFRRRVRAAILAAAAPHPVTDSPRLSAIAQWYANELALGWSQQALDGRLEGKIVALGRPYERVHTSVLVLDRADIVDASTLLRGIGHRFLGLGVVQSARNGAMAGRIWVVALIGQ